MKANIALDYINEKQYKCPDVVKARIAYARKKANAKKVRSALKGAFINDGKMILCDGYMAVRFEPIDNIATVPEEVAMQTIGKFIDNVSQNKGDSITISKATVLTACATVISEYNAYKKKMQATNRYWRFSHPYPYIAINKSLFDARLLKDCVNLIEPNINDNIVLCLSQNTKHPKKSVYIKGNDCDGVVLPISHVTENYPLNIPNIGE